METADALYRTLASENVRDFEVANVVDVLDGLVASTTHIANAITPLDAAPGHDEAGGTITSLTEATMGITSGLHRIAEAIGDLAEAVREGADHGSADP